MSDIRLLPFGKEFDLVLSVGLLEHFPDEMKPEVADWHRRFLKPGGYAVMTTPRNQLRSRLFSRIMPSGIGLFRFATGRRHVRLTSIAPRPPQ